MCMYWRMSDCAVFVCILYVALVRYLPMFWKFKSNCKALWKNQVRNRAIDLTMDKGKEGTFRWDGLLCDQFGHLRLKIILLN